MFKKFYCFLFHRIINKTPESFRKLRSWCVKKFILSSGKNLNIGRKCKIHKNTIILDNSGIGYGCEIPNGVKIGKNVMMGPNVIMFTQNHNTSNIEVPMRLQGMRELLPIIIEDDVWIGARVCILPGVKIGKGAVIGACAVVAKNVPDYAVVVGNPGKIVKYRNLTNEVIMDAKMEN